MFFKSLEIHGFKSFADKTVLNFDAQTTAVVGSNGNGKSNISDALRWVMGEQGAKTLRGEKMEDVIFHGTTDRKPMGFAKVALCIDNTDRALAVDADEVTISRKLYRTGESEYLINGAKSRLKDIQEMLLGTGLGRDGYSIIGQGRVAEIVNARGTQRREIFEEAAGISLFLHKKAEAEKELESAEENITRQKDIIRSDEERLPVLKKQSEKAVLAAELLDQKKELEISVGAAHYEERRTAIKKLDDDLLICTFCRVSARTFSPCHKSPPRRFLIIKYRSVSARFRDSFIILDSVQKIKRNRQLFPARFSCILSIYAHILNYSLLSCFFIY